MCVFWIDFISVFKYRILTLGGNMTMRSLHPDSTIYLIIGVPFNICSSNTRAPQFPLLSMFKVLWFLFFRSGVWFPLCGFSFNYTYLWEGLKEENNCDTSFLSVLYPFAASSFPAHLYASHLWSSYRKRFLRL